MTARQAAGPDGPLQKTMEIAMGRELERVGRPLGGFLKAAVTVLLLGLMVAAGERSLAPLMMERPDDRTPADVHETDAVYRSIASDATVPDALQEPQQDF
jgi:hypothetical protein